MMLSSSSAISLLFTLHLIFACIHAAEAMTLEETGWRQPVLPGVMERSEVLQTALFLGCSVLVPEDAVAATEPLSALHRSSTSSVKQKVRLNIQTNHATPHSAATSRKN